MTPEQLQQLQLQMQLQTAYIGAGATLLGAIIGFFVALLTQRNQSKTRESEERRWYLSFYLPRQIEALSNLYSTLMDCTHSINTIHSYPTLVFPMWYTEVFPKIEALSRTVGQAFVYVDDDNARLKLILLNNALNDYSDTIFAQGMPDKSIPQTFDLTGLRQLWADQILYLQSALRQTIPDSIRKAEAY